jgi:hypothetical protein
MFQTTNQVLVAGCCWWTNPHYRFCEDHSELDPFGISQTRSEIGHCFEQKTIQVVARSITFVP